MTKSWTVHTEELKLYHTDPEFETNEFQIIHYIRVKLTEKVT